MTANKTPARSNVSMIALGLSEVREGSAIVEGGIAHLAEGIADSWGAALRWSYGKDESEVVGVCRIGEMYIDKRNAKGERDTRFLPAFFDAIAENFGVEGGFSTADKVAFNRAFSIAAAYIGGAPVTFADTEVTRKGKAVKVRAVQVPVSVAFDLKKDDGTLTETGQTVVSALQSSAKLTERKAISVDEALGRADAMLVDCVGGKDGLLGKVPSATDISKVLRPVAVNAGYMMPVKSRSGDGGDKGAAFINALDYVAKCLDSLGGDEPLVALANESEKRLFAVGEAIAAYFAEVGGVDDTDAPAV
jgi:hypothetical protein